MRQDYQARPSHATRCGIHYASSLVMAGLGLTTVHQYSGWSDLRLIQLAGRQGRM